MSQCIISIIIPTYNKSNRLMCTLKNLQYAKCSDKAELIVVNDGSTDNTSDVIDECFEKYLYSSYLKMQKININHSGRAFARNTGVNYASADLLLFLDDDIIITPNLLPEHISCKKDNQIVRGTIYDLPYLKFFDNPYGGTFKFSNRIKKFLPKLNMEWNYDTLCKEYLNKYSKMSSFEKDILRVYNERREAKYRWIGCVGTNFSITLNTLNKVNGFDEAFGTTWGCEDLEFGYRQYKNKTDFIKNSMAVCYHMSHYRHGYQKEHAINMEYFFKKHPEWMIKTLELYFRNEINICEWLKMN